MLNAHDITGLRRSLAMAPLSRDATERLLDSCEQMARQRSLIRTVLDNLPTTVGQRLRFRPVGMIGRHYPTDDGRGIVVSYSWWRRATKWRWFVQPFGPHGHCATMQQAIDEGTITANALPPSR